MQIALIAALSDNGVIGRNNQLPWHYPEDLKYFRRMTLHKPIIMGRKTWESMGGKPLPLRHNIVLTQDLNFTAIGCTVAHSKQEALDLSVPAEEVMIIGGEKIFQLFLEDATRLYLSFIHETIEGDTFFPQVNWQDWKKISEETHQNISWVIFERQ